jgi:hypothetical protein
VRGTPVPPTASTSATVAKLHDSRSNSNERRISNPKSLPHCFSFTEQTGLDVSGIGVEAIQGFDVPTKYFVATEVKTVNLAEYRQAKKLQDSIS